MKQYNFLNFPELQTDHLLLRKLSAHDAAAIHELRADPKIAELTGRVPSTGIEDAQNFILKIEELITNYECIYWSIILKQNDTLVGTICFWNFDMEKETVEIGYELLPEYQGKGIMGEAIETVIRFGFEQMETRLITAFPSAKNTSSVKLLEKIGFKSDPSIYQHSHDNVDQMLTYILARSEPK